MASLTAKSLTRFADRWLMTALALHGFRRRDRVFERVRGEVTHLLELQKRRPEQSDVTVNCGVFVPGFFEHYTLAPEPSEPELTHCVIAARIGMLKPDHLDEWWTLQSNQEEQERIAAEILSDIEAVAIPFLDRLTSKGAIIEFLSLPRSKERALTIPPSDPVRLVYLGILHHLRGDSTDARRIIAEAKIAARKTPLETHVDLVLSRLSAE